MADGNPEAAFLRRLRETIETLLACDAVRNVRVDLGHAVLAGIKQPEGRQRRLAQLKTSELVTITFEFARTTRTTDNVNKRLVEEWRGQDRTGITPHYRLLSQIAHVFMPTSVTRTPQATIDALVDFYLQRRPESGLTVPKLDLLAMHDPRAPADEGDLDARRTTLSVPSPPAALLAAAFRWARMTVEHTAPEIGEAETRMALGQLDRLVRRLIRRSIAGRPAEQVRDVISEMRTILGRAGHRLPSIEELSARAITDPIAEPPPIFSQPDLDALCAQFSSAVRLKAMSASAVKKDQQRHGARRGRRYGR